MENALDAKRLRNLCQRVLALSIHFMHTLWSRHWIGYLPPAPRFAFSCICLFSRNSVSLSNLVSRMSMLPKK